MIVRLSAVVIIIANAHAFGQSTGSQSSSHLQTEAVTKSEDLKVDSARVHAAAEFDSIRSSYDNSAMSTAGIKTEIIDHKLESLRNLDQPIDRVIQQIDSAEQWRNRRIQALKDDVERLNGEVSEINTLKLPTGLEDEGEKLTGGISDVNAPFPDPEFPLERGHQTGLPGLENPLNNAIPGSTGISLPGTDPDGITEQINEYPGQLNGIPSDIEETSALAEEQVMGIPEMTEAASQISEGGKVTEMTGSLPDQEVIRDVLVNQVQQQAVDHFQGREDQLQQAMEMVAKYKKKYGSFQSLEEIAQRKGNPLRDTPFIERFIPGIALQIHRRDTWMVDFNVYAGYRLYPRFLAGGGWNQRVAYDPDEHDFKPGLRIFGPRIFGEFRIGEGFSARMEAEYMNTSVPPKFSSANADQHGREWVFTTVAGMKKEFRFFKNIKGTMMLLYNLHDPHHRSPYVDKLITRFGFEFPMKKKSGNPE